MLLQRAGRGRCQESRRQAMEPRVDSSPTSEILLRHGRFVQTLARALIRDLGAADDVAQEVWMQWLRRGAAAVEAPRGWLQSSVRHLAANARRASERRTRHEALGARPEEPRSPAEELVHAELLHRVVDAVFALDEPYRATILARYFRGLEARELARQSGEPLATVRSRERRALELLRARLDREHGGRAAWAVALGKLVEEHALAGVAGSTGLAWIAAVLVLGSGVLWWRVASGDTVETVAVVTGSEAAPGVSAPPSPAMLGPDARTEVAVEDTAASETPPEVVAPGTLTGHTLDTDGAPLGGVTVSIQVSAREPVTTVSDEHGRFSFTGLAYIAGVSAERRGYAFLHATDPEADPMEPWRPMRVTLAPVAELSVRVRDARGRPIEGMEVLVQPRREEQVDALGAEITTYRSGSHDTVTDAEGYALVEDVWTGVKLEVDLDLEAGGDSGEITVDRQLDGELLLDGSPGAPIVIGPGGAELSAVWGEERVLHGLVVDAQGEPVAHCSVEATDDGYGASEQGHWLARAPTDEQGRFTLGFQPASLRGPVRLAAGKSGPAPRELGRSESGGPGVTTYLIEFSAETSLAVADLAGTRPVLTLAQLGTLALSGEILDTAGRPLVWAEHQIGLHGSAPSSEPHRRVKSIASSGGAFLYYDLQPGRYDLVVARRGPLQSSRERAEPVFTRFAGLAAGVENLRLRLRAPPDSVRVLIRGRALTRVSLAQLSPTRAFPSAPTAARALVADEPALWLPARDARASESAARAEGTWILVHDDARGAGEVELLLGEPGWYRIGAACEGRAAVATPLLRFEAGEHVLDVDPPALGTLRGRLIGDGTREFLGLQLADARGAPLPNSGPSSDARLDVHPVKASGAFVLRDLPADRYRLRAGSVDELEQGRFRTEVELEITPGENDPIEIEL